MSDLSWVWDLGGLKVLQSRVCTKRSHSHPLRRGLGMEHGARGLHGSTPTKLVVGREKPRAASWLGEVSL